MNDLLSNDSYNDNDTNTTFDNFFYDDRDSPTRRQVIPAKLTADGISVTYSAPPLPTPSPDQSPIIPAKQSSVWYWDYGRSGTFSSASSVPLTWSSTSFRSSVDEIRTPTSLATFCNDAIMTVASPKGKVCIDSKVDFSPQVIRDDDDDDDDNDVNSVSPAYSVLYDDDGNRINVVTVTVTSSPLSPDCDRYSCKRDYYDEAEDDYPSSWEHDEEVYFEDVEILQGEQLQQQQQHQQHYYLYHHEQQQQQESGRSSEARADAKSKTASRSKLRLSANAWSDVGTNFHSSVELFQCRDRFRPTKLIKAYDGRGSKCASDSNIMDAVEMMEPGLRKIRKDSYHTTTPTHSSTECCQDRFEPDYPDQFDGCTEQPESYYHEVLQKVAEEGYFYNCNYQYEPVYQDMTEEDEDETKSSENRLEPVYREVSGEEESRSQQCDESGFFSWQAGDNKHVTKIPINLFPSDAEDLSDFGGVVTVNGRRLGSDPTLRHTKQDSLTTDDSLTTVSYLYVTGTSNICMQPIFCLFC